MQMHYYSTFTIVITVNIFEFIIHLAPEKLIIRRQKAVQRTYAHYTYIYKICNFQEHSATVFLKCIIKRICNFVEYKSVLYMQLHAVWYIYLPTYSPNGYFRLVQTIRAPIENLLRQCDKFA